MDAEGLKQTPDVVSDRLPCSDGLGGDLFRRATLLQKTKHLDLTGREIRGWRCGAVVGVFLDQPEDADHPFTVLERHPADLDGDPRSGGRDEVGGRLCRREVPSIFWANSSRARRLSSGATTEVK